MKLLDTFKLLVAIALCSVLYSCSEDNEPAEKLPEIQDKEESVITCDVSDLTFDAGNGSKTITFVTNGDWSAKVLGNVSWCTLSSSQGMAGTASITVNVGENTTYMERNASIFIQCDDKTHTIVVTQKQMDALLLNSSRYEVAQEGGTIVVGIKANIDYQLEIMGDAKNWIKESKGRTLSAYSHTFIVEANEGSGKREGEIRFTSDTQSETVWIYQAGASSVLMLTQSEYTVSDEGETISIEIKSNVDFGVEMPNVDWVREEKDSRALSSHTLRYVIAPNSSYDERSAYIVFYDKNSSLKEKLHIIQKQRNAILLSNKTVTVAQTGGKVDAEIKSNIDYTIEIAPSCKDWITENKSRALVANIHSFTVAPNDTYDDRTGEIYFYDQARSLKETLVITQKQKDVITVSKKQYEVGSQANSIQVDVFSNVQFDVTIEATWIKLTRTSNETGKNYQLQFSIEENTNNQERSGKIVITDKSKTIKQEISVKQLMKAQQPTPEDKDPEGNVGDMNWG